MTRLEELLLLWQDQTLTSEQLRELKTLLDSPTGRAKLAEDVFLTGVVLESLRAQGAARELLGVRADVPEPDEAGRRPETAPASGLRYSPGQRRRVLGWALAAAVLLAAGVAFWSGSFSPAPVPASPVFAQVEQVQGETFVVSKQQDKRVAQEGHVLMPGQGIATQGADSEAVVQMENAVRLKLGGDTMVFTTAEAEEPKAAGPRVVLEQGDLLVEVTRSLKRKRMTVETPLGVAVTETEDAALHFSDAVGIAVVRGEVTFTHKATGQSIQLTAGQYAAGTQQGALHASQFFSGMGTVWTTFPRSGLGVNALGYTVAFAPDGQTLAAASRAAESGIRLGPVDGEDTAQERPGRLCVAISPDGALLATADQGNVLLYDRSTGASHSVLKGDRRLPPTSLAFTPDSKTLVVGRRGWLDGAGVAEVWDVTNGTLRATLRGHTASVTALAIAPDGKLLATGSLDKTVVVWDLPAGQERTRVLMMPAQVVWAVAFAPDGRTLAIATGPDDFRLRSAGEIKLWDVASEKARTTLRGHNRAVTGIAFSADGRTLISGSADSTVRFWDTVSSREYGMLKGHQAAPGFEALAVALSADGQRLATASFDRTVKVWKTTWNRTKDGSRITAQADPGNGRTHWQHTWAFLARR